MKILAEDKSSAVKVSLRAESSLTGEVWKSLSLEMSRSDLHFELSYSEDQFKFFCAELQKTCTPQAALKEMKSINGLEVARSLELKLKGTQKLKAYYSGISFISGGASKLTFGFVEDEAKSSRAKGSLVDFFNITGYLSDQRNAPRITISMPQKVFLKFRKVCLKAVKELAKEKKPKK